MIYHDIPLKKADIPLLVLIAATFGQTRGLRGSSPWSHGPGMGWIWLDPDKPFIYHPPNCFRGRNIKENIMNIEDYYHVLWKNGGTTPGRVSVRSSEDVVLDFWARLLSPSMSTGQLRPQGKFMKFMKFMIQIGDLASMCVSFGCTV